MNILKNREIRRKNRVIVRIIMLVIALIIISVLSWNAIVIATNNKLLAGLRNELDETKTEIGKMNEVFKEWEFILE